MRLHFHQGKPMEYWFYLSQVEKFIILMHLANIADKHDVTLLCFNRDYDPEAAMMN